jgi:hypothetical protein
MEKREKTRKLYDECVSEIARVEDLINVKKNYMQCLFNASIGKRLRLIERIKYDINIARYKSFKGHMFLNNTLSQF